MSGRPPAITVRLGGASQKRSGLHRMKAEMGHYILFLRSMHAAAILHISKAFGDWTNFASKFRKLVLDESFVAIVIGHLEVVRIMNHRGTLLLTKRHPDLLVKYFRNYLAKRFSKKTRREIMKFHYQFLEHICASLYEQILDNGSVLWSDIIDDNSYTISLSFNSKWHNEGDISLTLTRMIFRFTKSPSRLFPDIRSTARLMRFC